MAKEDDVFQKFKGLEVDRSGTKIVLPPGMSFDEALVWLKRRRDQDEQKVAFREEIIAYPLEGAYALLRVLEEKYGFVSLKSTPTFFGEDPPAMVGLEIDVGRTAQVPWGRMIVPGVEGYIETHFLVKGKRLIFCIAGEVKRKHEAELMELARLVREHCARGSIYRSKAIRVEFPVDGHGKPRFDAALAPKFMDLSGVKVSDFVLSRDTMEQVQINVLTPVQKTAQCIAAGVPTKRTVLFEGPFGTGKTMGAFVSAKACVENGWTYLYVKNVRELPQALEFAKQYEPVMLFVEDIDTALEGERNDEMNEILNTIDGIESKGSKIMTILTTNNVEKIHRAALRFGRFDAVIPFRAPDGPAVEQLIRNYGRGLVPSDEDLRQVGQALDGNIAATIREVVERAKLAAVSRLNPGEPIRLTSHDLMASASAMLSHLHLLREQKKDTRTPMEQFAESLAKTMIEGANAVSKGNGPSAQVLLGEAEEGLRDLAE